MLTDPLQKTLMCLNICNSVDTISVWYFHGLLTYLPEKKMLELADCLPTFVWL